MRQLKTDAASFWSRSSMISFGHQIPNGNKCALPVVNAAIKAAKQYLANLKLIPANMSTGISVEYSLSPRYCCTIRIRFYSPCSLQDIDKHAEWIQRHLSAILKYYSNAANMDLRLKGMEKDLMLNINNVRKTLGLPPSDQLDHIGVMKPFSKAFGYEHK